VSVASLLLLADGRFPDGTHAHSYGLEAAVSAGRVRGAAQLAQYVEARLWTSGRTEAGAAVLAARGTEPLEAIDDALALRTPSSAVRTTSRALGRSLLRTADRLWPDQPIARTPGRAPMQPVVLGAVAARSGCTPAEAALCSTHGLAAALATSALRLLGLDPFDVAAVLRDLRGSVEAAATSVVALGGCDELPHLSTPFGELDPELQQTLEPRLFGS
jgi:urease accessory protein